MSVELEPAELGFKRPFTQEVSQVLRLHNPHNDPVAFKVKTTAPKQYCVRPNSGKISPGGSVEVQVLLQAMKEDPPPDARCRDKFLVQSVGIHPDAANDTVTQIWGNLDQALGGVQEKRIRVTFLPADGAPNGTAPRESQSLDSSSAAATGASHYGNAGPDDGEKSFDADQTAMSGSGMGSSVGLGAVSAALPSREAMQQPIAAMSASMPAREDVQKQLDEAKATIARLRQQAEEGIRQRKPQEAVGKAADYTKQSVQQVQRGEGVPVQVTAGLCLLCFLIAYIFF